MHWHASRLFCATDTGVGTQNQGETSHAGQQVATLPGGPSVNVPHPVSGLSSAAKQPNYGRLCFDGNRTGCQYY